MMAGAKTDWAREERLLATAIGLPGSGRVRYGAAMQFHRAGRITDAALEAYRVCSANDADDPGQLLADWGLAPVAAATPAPAQQIRALIEASLDYLGRLTGPGVVEVRQGLARWGTGAITPAPRAHPVAETQLPVALAALAPDEPALATAIAAASPHLTWISYTLYDPEAIGAAFLGGHAYASLVGDGPIRAEGFDFGLFVIAPHILYRDHRHAAPELYAPLTGPHGWRFAPGAALTLRDAHQPVWNPPQQPHATKVGPLPFLCLYGWTADTDSPAVVIPANDWPELEALRLKETAR
jgi:hypothetical protein